MSASLTHGGGETLHAQNCFHRTNIFTFSMLKIKLVRKTNTRSWYTGGIMAADGIISHANDPVLPKHPGLSTRRLRISTQLSDKCWTIHILLYQLFSVWWKHQNQYNIVYNLSNSSLPLQQIGIFSVIQTASLNLCWLLIYIQFTPMQGNVLMYKSDQFPCDHSHDLSHAHQFSQIQKANRRV